VRPKVVGVSIVPNPLRHFSTTTSSPGSGSSLRGDLTMWAQLRVPSLTFGTVGWSHLDLNEDNDWSLNKGSTNLLIRETVLQISMTNPMHAPATG